MLFCGFFWQQRAEDRLGACKIFDFLFGGGVFKKPLTQWFFSQNSGILSVLRAIAGLWVLLRFLSREPEVLTRFGIFTTVRIPAIFFLGFWSVPASRSMVLLVYTFPAISVWKVVVLLILGNTRWLLLGVPRSLC